MLQLNPNIKLVNAVKKRLYMNGGFCPCAPGHEGDIDYSCPCKKLIETEECCCSLFLKVEND